ncbi:MAG: HIT family protein [Pseudonocardia sp.]|nr:HIT family protein [Pseudonocardia sp.]
MTTVFSRIIAGELPARFVWSDEHAVAFLSVNPVGPGHTLVVSRLEVDRWTDASSTLLAHLSTVAHAVGRAVDAVWAPPRVGLMVAGFEIPHLHLHVFPAADMAPFHFANAAAAVDPDEQDGYAAALRTALRDAGHGACVAG